MDRDQDVSGFVLAGGQSRRMGCDKAYLKLNGQPLLLRAVNLLKVHVSSVTILGPRDRYDAFGIPVLPDQWPGRGPLGALLTALLRSRNSWNLFLACDLPLLNARFIELLICSIQAGECEAVVPFVRGSWHPLCAAYRRDCASPMRDALERGESAIIDILPQLNVSVITNDHLEAAGIEEEVLENINFPEDWQRIVAKYGSITDARP